MGVAVRLRGKVSGSWSVADVPLERQLVFETNTRKAKIGDGVTPYPSLAYLWYTIDEIDTLLGAKANASHGHTTADVSGLDAALAAKATPADITTAINNLKDGVAGAGDTLQKLYNLIISGDQEETVANIAERDALDITSPTRVFVINDGDGNWAYYRSTTTGVGATFVKLSDPDLLNAVMSAAQIKSSYESNPDTNALTNALLSKLNGIAAGATANAADSALRDRTTHTGEQAISTITGLQDALDGKVESSALSESIDDRVDALIQSSNSIQKTYDDGGNLLSLEVIGLPDQSTCIEMQDDFLAGNTESGEIGTLNWESTVSSGTVGIESSQAGRPGIVRLSSLTTIAGRAAMNLGLLTVQIGGGVITMETSIYIVSIPDAVNDFIIYFGLGDNVAGNDTDGTYIVFRRSISGTNWAIGSASAGTTGNSASGVAMTVGWHKLKVEIAANGSSFEGFVDGVSLGIISANMPTGAGRQLAPMFKCLGVAGTGASRYFLVDYWRFKQVFTTAR